MGGAEDSSDDDVVILEDDDSIEERRVVNKDPVEIEPYYLIETGCGFILYIGNILSCSILSTTRAMMIFHRYQRERKEVNFFAIAGAALALVTAVCEDNIEFNQVAQKINSFIRRKEKKTGSERNVQLVSQELCYHVFEVVKHQLKPDTAHKLHFYNDVAQRSYHHHSRIWLFRCGSRSMEYAVPYLRQLQLLPRVDESLISTITYFVLKLLNTFYHSERCLDYQAVEIAVASMQFALQLSNVDSDPDFKFLNREILAKVSEDKIQTIIDDMLMVLDVATELEG